MRSPQEFVVDGYWWLLAGLCFFGYPLAVLPLGLLPLQHHLSLPATLLASLLAVPVVVACWRPVRRRYLVGMVVLAAAVGLSAVRFRCCWRAHLELLGLVLVPLAVCLSARRWRPGGVRERRLILVAAVLWALQVVLAAWSQALRLEAVGLPGNRNWMAALVLATAPWAAVALSRAPARWLAGAAWPVVVAATGGVLMVCRSRGAWVALLVFGLVWLFHRLRTRLERVLFVTLLLLAPVVALFAIPGRLAAVVREDVRIPLWGRTVAMIVEHDWLAGVAVDAVRLRTPQFQARDPAGVGAGRFRKVFTPYRARSTYHQRQVAAPVTVHPHNELLNVMAQIGVAGALAWAALLLPLLFRGRVLGVGAATGADRDATGDDGGGAGEPFGVTAVVRECARFSGTVVVAHGMLDMTLVQPPTNLVALVGLGLCWRAVREPEAAADETAAPCGWPRVGVALAAVLAVPAAWLVWQDWQLDRYHRRGYIAERMVRNYRAAFDAYRQAARYGPREDLRADLFAGVLAVERLGEPVLGLRLLARVMAADPNFGHVNEKVGKGLGMLGRHGQALRHFERERQLYPLLPESYQRLYTGAALAGVMRPLPVLHRELTDVYRGRLAAALTPAERQRLTAQWVQAMADGDGEAATSAANALCRPVHTAFIDPVFFAVTAEGRWPDAFVRDRLNRDDLACWQEADFVGALAAESADPEPSGRVRALLERVREGVSVSAARRFEAPTALWERGEGGALSVGYLLVELLRAAGVGSALVADGESVCAVLAVLPREVGRVRLESGLPARFVPKAEWAGPAAGERLCLGFLPQQFLLKNQILGVALAEFAPERGRRLNRVPSLELLECVAMAGTPRAEATLRQLADACIDEPLRQMYQERGWGEPLQDGE